ncbi:MAG TPA: hypothetical protein VHK67_03630 [Rhabdochlamydiaceae bacterium]|jgi:hypothetical protein|nr:hypothetical protein [Rhabdochlamydiaceae bacterium]
MTSETSSGNLNGLREILWESVKSFTQAKEFYDGFVRTLESKKNEQVPLAKNSAFQAEVNKTHAIYMKYIEVGITNLTAQSGIAEEIKALFAHHDIDLVGLSTSLGEIQSRLNPLIDQLKVIEAEIKKLEDKIVELIS